MPETPSPARPMDGPFRDVVDFHRAFGHAVGTVPALPDPATVALRRRLIAEEYGELMDALAAGDLVGIADGGADLCVVAIGTMAACGIPFAEVWEAVMESNMAKLGGGFDADGKVCKPKNWSPPDVAGILARQGPIGGTPGSGGGEAG